MSEQSPKPAPVPGVVYEIADLRRVYCVVRGLMGIYGPSCSLAMLTTMHTALTSLSSLLDAIELVGPSVGVVGGDKLFLPSEPFADMLDAVRNACWKDRPEHPMAMSLVQMATDARMKGRQVMEQISG